MRAPEDPRISALQGGEYVKYKLSRPTGGPIPGPSVQAQGPSRLAQKKGGVASQVAFGLATYPYLAFRRVTYPAAWP